MPGDSRHTARLGRELVVAQLRNRGFTVTEATVEQRPTLLLERAGVRRRVHVSAKLRGTWQTSIAYGAEEAGPELRGSTWIFVDVGRPEPAFYVVPEPWMVEDIYATHQANLARHGGRRKHSPSSKHHAVRLERIEDWCDRWDMLETEVTSS